MKLWGSVRQGAAKVAFEADKMVRIRKQEAAISDIQKQVQLQYTALGEKVIELFQAGMIDHPQVAAVNQQICRADGAGHPAAGRAGAHQGRPVC